MSKKQTAIQRLVTELNKSPAMFASTLILIDNMKLLEVERDIIEFTFVDGYHHTKSTKPLDEHASEYFT